MAYRYNSKQLRDLVDAQVAGEAAAKFERALAADASLASILLVSRRGPVVTVTTAHVDRLPHVEQLARTFPAFVALETDGGRCVIRFSQGTDSKRQQERTA